MKRIDRFAHEVVRHGAFAVLALALAGCGSKATRTIGPIIGNPPGADWSTITLGETFHGIAWSGARFVAVGSQGVAYTSPDGIAWTNGHTTTSLTLRSVASSGSRFVAVGGDALFPGVITSSENGVNWVTPLTGGHVLMSVTWSGTQFVAVGESGAVLTSPDGLVWTPRSSGSIQTLFSVIWAGNQFVAVGEQDTILTSPDGIAWTGRVTGSSGYFDLAWSGSRFVAVGRQGGIAISTDGVTWAPGVPLDPLTHLTTVAWNGSEFVLGNENGAAYSSPDGIVWAHRGGQARTLSDFLWTGSLLIGVGGRGGVMILPPGGDLTRVPTPCSDTIHALWSGTQFVAVGDFGAVLTSPDGRTWTSRASGTIKSLRGVTWSGTQYVAVGQGFDGTNETGAAILTSLDGIDWITRDSQGVVTLFGVAWSPVHLKFVAVGDGVLTSSNGASWIVALPGDAYGLSGVATLEHHIAVSGYGNRILGSHDAVSWSAQNPGTTGDAFLSVAWGSGRFVTVGYNSSDPSIPAVLSSPDGLTWTRENGAPRVWLQSIIWTGDQFVAVGQGNWIETSPNGVQWTTRTWAHPGGGVIALNAVAGNQLVVVAGGEDGTLIRSP